MNVNIPSQQDDDPVFVSTLVGIVQRLLKHELPEEVFVIRIDRWFDHKWLRFSGIGIVRFDDFRLHIDSALDEFRQDQITFPPFSPSRVLDEYHFFRVGGTDYFESVPDRFVRRSMPAHSSKNLHKRVADFSQSGLFVWFNSNTLETGHASLMVYTVNNKQVETWFASFERADAWKLLQVKNIAREQVELLVGSGPE